MVYNKFLFAPPKYRVTRSRPESATRAATASLIFTSRESRALNKNYVNAFSGSQRCRRVPTDRSDHNGMHALQHFCTSNWL
jgi:hypothetical protein